MSDRNPIIPLFSVWFNKAEGCVEYVLHKDACETVVRAEARRNRPPEAMRDFAYLNSCASSTALNIDREIRGDRRVHPIDRLVLPNRSRSSHSHRGHRSNHRVPHHRAPPVREHRSRAGRSARNDNEWDRAIAERSGRGQDHRDDYRGEREERDRYDRTRPRERRPQHKEEKWTEADRRNEAAEDSYRREKRSTSDEAGNRKPSSSGAPVSSGTQRTSPQPREEKTSSKNSSSKADTEKEEGEIVEKDRKAKPSSNEKSAKGSKDSSPSKPKKVEEEPQKTAAKPAPKNEKESEKASGGGADNVTEENYSEYSWDEEEN